MCSIVELRNKLQPQRVIPPQLSARIQQFFEIPPGRAQAPDVIEREPDLDPCASALGQRLDVPLRNLAFVKNVGFQVDAAARRSDGSQLGFIKTRSVRQYFESVAVQQLGFCQKGKQSTKFGAIQRTPGRLLQVVAKTPAEKSQV